MEAMNFIRAVQTLQQKPEYIRRRVLVVSVGLSMAVIIGVWLMITSRRMSSDFFAVQDQLAEIETAESPFDMLKDIGVNITNEIRAQFK